MRLVSHTLLSALLLAGAAAADTGTDPRQSLSNDTYSEHEPLVLDDATAAATKDEDNVQQRTARIGQSVDPNFWFYDVDVSLFSDFDRDGYFFGLDILFDADTHYAVADVYAVLYLSYEYGPWNEYAATNDFTLFGTSGTDDYTVETELVSGYPTGSYDILIELYDADTNAWLASIGPEEAVDLSYLPLEDSTRDAGTGETQVVVNSGGGSAGLLLLFGLLAVRMTLRPQAARLSK
jgi:hypothetical protein